MNDPLRYFEEFPTSSELIEFIHKYPRLFRGKLPRSYSYVYPGWVAIIDALLGAVDRLLGGEDAKVFRINQIKEKFGTLRFYWSFHDDESMVVDVLGGGDGEAGDAGGTFETRPAPGGDVYEKIHTLVEAAVDATAKTCSVCGEPGEMRMLSSDPDFGEEGFITLVKGKAPERWGEIACRCIVHARRSGWPA